MPPAIEGRDDETSSSFRYRAQLAIGGDLPGCHGTKYGEDAVRRLAKPDRGKTAKVHDERVVLRLDDALSRLALIRSKLDSGACVLQYGDCVVDWAVVAAIGTVLGGLALPLAFLQLEAQRRERLRTQVSKIGAWTRIEMESDSGFMPAPRTIPRQATPRGWRVVLFLRNSSELPVMIHRVELTLTPWGYNLVQTDAGPEPYSDKKFGVPRTILMFVDETIEPESTQEDARMDSLDASFEIPQPPKVSVNQIVVSDATGRLWDIRPTKARVPKPVHWWKRKAVLSGLRIGWRIW